MIKLYDCTTAPSPRRTRMFLAEKGIEYENIQVDLTKGEQMSEAFRKINPGCTVPAMVTEVGDVLTENAGISVYLEALHPEPPLLGRTPIEKAEIATWNWRCEMGGLMSAAEALRNSSPAMKDRALPGPKNIPQIPELAERGLMKLGWFFKTLNRQLTANEYVAGDSYSVADITATIVVDFGRWVKVFPQEDQTALLAWHARMKERPSYKA
ncbi:MAG: glutathione S-transferase [Litorimonas sp.]